MKPSITSVEELTNLVSPDFNKMAGRTKDLAAAAVLLTSIMSFCCALVIYVPKIWGNMNTFFVDKKTRLV
jgi:diacylglycerol kinase